MDTNQVFPQKPNRVHVLITISKKSVKRLEKMIREIKNLPETTSGSSRPQESTSSNPQSQSDRLPSTRQREVDHRHLQQQINLIEQLIGNIIENRNSINTSLLKEAFKAIAANIRNLHPGEDDNIRQQWTQKLRRLLFQARRVYPTHENISATAASPENAEIRKVYLMIHSLPVISSASDHATIVSLFTSVSLMKDYLQELPNSTEKSCLNRNAFNLAIRKLPTSMQTALLSQCSSREDNRWTGLAKYLRKLITKSAV